MEAKTAYSCYKEELLNLFKENVTPKIVYRIFECKVDLSFVSFAEITVSSRSLVKHLQGCGKIVLLAATLGTGADFLIRKFSVQDMEKTLSAQKICASLIESYLDEKEIEFSQDKELKGLFSVTRYSPGYGDFDISYQKDILNLLDASRIGLSLTDGFMLTPSKSVTAVIGFSEKQKQTKLSCKNCSDKKCNLREVDLITAHAAY